MNRKNIILIGMPGAGKSTVGVVLAKTLKKPFIDTDLIIQQREDKLLQEIINREGIKKFLEVEESAVLSLDVHGHIIATGGSVVYSKAAMEHLKAGGLVIYLQLAYEQIKRRIKNIKTRGIAMEKGQELKDLYSERVPLYESYADLTIDCSGKNDEELIAEIKERLEKLF